MINRCGVIAGPVADGQVDQGVFTFWLLRHHFGRPLTYIGYGGAGRQVRDLLHVDDLVDLIDRPARATRSPGAGSPATSAAGRDVSLSLLETTELCRELTGNEVPIEAADEVRAGDVPLYLSDCARLFAHTDWRPRRDARQALADTHAWLREHEEAVAASLGIGA